jgi:hypothetical protein
VAPGVTRHLADQRDYGQQARPRRQHGARAGDRPISLSCRAISLSCRAISLSSCFIAATPDRDPPNRTPLRADHTTPRSWGAVHVADTARRASTDVIDSNAVDQVRPVWHRGADNSVEEAHYRPSQPTAAPISHGSPIGIMGGVALPRGLDYKCEGDRVSMLLKCYAG